MPFDRQWPSIGSGRSRAPHVADLGVPILLNVLDALERLVCLRMTCHAVQQHMAADQEHSLPLICQLQMRAPRGPQRWQVRGSQGWRVGSALRGSEHTGYTTEIKWPITPVPHPQVTSTKPAEQLQSRRAHHCDTARKAIRRRQGNGSCVDASLQREWWSAHRTIGRAQGGRRTRQETDAVSGCQSWLRVSAAATAGRPIVDDGSLR